MKIASCDSVELQIRAVRARQAMMWPRQDHDPFKYLVILGEKVGRSNIAAADAFLWDGLPDEVWDPRKLARLQDELVQVAAVAKAMIECLERDCWQPKGGMRGPT